MWGTSPSKPVILIVDDEEMNLDLLEMQLEGAGFKTLQAKDGMHAIEMLVKHDDIRLVLLDWMMPGMDGMEFLEKLRSNSKYRSLPVIMQTARGQKSEVLKAVNAGANYYLIKPYTQEKLLDEVRTALQEASHIQSSVG